MSTYNNSVKTEIISQVLYSEQEGNSCYRRTTKTNFTFETDENKPVSKFPENEEPKILGHGSSTQTVQDENDSSSYRQLGSNSTSDSNLEKYKTLLTFEDAPEHLKFNPYIRRGYRTFLPTKLCLQSVFWWTNETINIWTHLFGYLLFLGLTINDLRFLHHHADLSDKIIVGLLLVCFQLCMLLSSVYHIFSCRSEKDYDIFLTVDFFGIALSLLAIYISGVYYAFWCHQTLRNFYVISVIAMFITAMVVQIPQLKVSLNGKISVFIIWSLYGFIPLVHWTIESGGFENPLVKLLVPRVIIMYLLSGIAFVIYATRIPERWLSGKVDFCGHSHNWWHVFILLALYHWHNTGLVYAEFRLNNGCSIMKSFT